jgi:hypothetical protein
MELSAQPEMVNLKALACDIDALEQHYQPCIDAFPRIAATTLSKPQVYRKMIPSGHPWTANDSSALELAISTFLPLHHFESISDRGNHGFNGGDVVAGWKALSVCHVSDLHAKLPQSGAPCTFNPWLSDICANLVTACSLDPDKATVDDMDGLDERFFCRRCHSLEDINSVAREGCLDKFEVYTWRAAVCSSSFIRALSVSDMLLT